MCTECIAITKKLNNKSENVLMLMSPPCIESNLALNITSLSGITEKPFSAVYLTMWLEFLFSVYL